MDDLLLHTLGQVKTIIFSSQKIFKIIPNKVPVEEVLGLEFF